MEGSWAIAMRRYFSRSAVERSGEVCMIRIGWVVIRVVRRGMGWVAIRPWPLLVRGVRL